MTEVPESSPVGLVLAPFRALRYTAPDDALSALTSSPYDVVDAGGVAALEAASDDNVVHLILPRDDDGSGEDCYACAARTLERWRADGIVRPDPEPALYVYEQAGDGHVQRGLVGALALTDPRAGVVLPHEDVLPGPVADRLALYDAVSADLEPIFLLYDGQGGAAAQLLATIGTAPAATAPPATAPAATAPAATAPASAAGEAPAATAPASPEGEGPAATPPAGTDRTGGARADTPPAATASTGDAGPSATARADQASPPTAAELRRQPPLVDAVLGDGLRHRLWSVTDPALLAAVAEDLAPRRAVIADGHHRHAAYLQRQALRRRAGRQAGPWDAGLAMLVDDSGAAGPRVQAIHRVVLGRDAGELAALAAGHFVVHDLDGNDLAAALDALALAGGLDAGAHRLTVPPVGSGDPGAAPATRRSGDDRAHAAAEEHQRRLRRERQLDDARAAGAWAPRGRRSSGASTAGAGPLARHLRGQEPAAGDEADAPAQAREGQRPAHAFLLVSGDGGTLRLLTDADPQALEEHLPRDRSGAWRALDVAVLQCLLLEGAWGTPDGPAPVRVEHDVAAAVLTAARTGGTAVLLNPTPAASVREVAEAGERMPAKSTLFAPKPRSGLLLRDHRDA